MILATRSIKKSRRRSKSLHKKIRRSKKSLHKKIRRSKKSLHKKIRRSNKSLHKKIRRSNKSHRRSKKSTRKGVNNTLNKEKKNDGGFADYFPNIVKISVFPSNLDTDVKTLKTYSINNYEFYYDKCYVIVRKKQKNYEDLEFGIIYDLNNIYEATISGSIEIIENILNVEKVSVTRDGKVKKYAKETGFSFAIIKKKDNINYLAVFPGIYSSDIRKGSDRKSSPTKIEYSLSDVINYSIVYRYSYGSSKTRQISERVYCDYSTILYNFNINMLKTQLQDILKTEDVLKPELIYLKKNNIFVILTHIVNYYKLISIPFYRHVFFDTFSWSIPTEDNINNIVSFIEYNKCSYILEIGSGRGLWTAILKFMMVRIYATDDNSWYKDNDFYTDVNPIDYVEAISKYKDENACLFLCYPPNKDLLAEYCLENFNGKYLIYIVKTCYDDKCENATEIFFKILKENWTRVKPNKDGFVPTILEDEYDNNYTGLLEKEIYFFIKNINPIPISI